MDACFSLKKFKGNTTRIHESFFKNGTFLPPPDLSINIPTSPQDCNDFQSGHLRKKQHDYCDVSAIFGSICNHGVIFGFMNVLKGEALGYSIKMAHALRDHFPQNRLIVAYDIFCRISNNPLLVADGGFVPEMHAYNHGDDCRSDFCPKRKLGIGFEDGEDTERLWSVMRPIVTQSTVMRGENREDLLSLFVDSYNDSAIFKLVSRIGDDLKRASKLLEKLTQTRPLEGLPEFSFVQNQLQASNDALANESRAASKTAKESFIKKIKNSVRSVRNLLADRRHNSKL